MQKQKQRMCVLASWPNESYLFLNEPVLPAHETEFAKIIRECCSEDYCGEDDSKNLAVFRIDFL